MKFEASKSHENIVNAYHGEVVGEFLYQALSEKVQKEGNEALAQVFGQLAKEEKGHAMALARFMDEDLSAYAVSDKEKEGILASLVDPVQMLPNFVAGERKAGEEIYPQFSEIAKEEGFHDLANMYIELAKVEILHSERLAKELDNLSA